MEKWNIEYSGLKADDGLILFSAPCHPYKNGSNSAKRGSSAFPGPDRLHKKPNRARYLIIELMATKLMRVAPGGPTFQYSITPRHSFTAKPISSDLAQETRFSMLE
jgi:hypothetical protein